MYLESAWTKTDKNVVHIAEDAFDALTKDDDFEIIFERRDFCKRAVLSVESVRICKGSVEFIYPLECQLDPGDYTAAVFNVTTDQIVAEDILVRCYDQHINETKFKL